MELFFYATYVAKVFDLIVNQSPWLHEIQSNEKAYNVFAELLIHFYQSCETNFHRFELERFLSREFTGVGAYPMASLLNHSCAPNVMRVMHYNCQQSVVAIRVIQAGEQLFDCYG